MLLVRGGNGALLPFVTGWFSESSSSSLLSRSARLSLLPLLLLADVTGVDRGSNKSSSSSAEIISIESLDDALSDGTTSFLSDPDDLALNRGFLAGGRVASAGDGRLTRLGPGRGYGRLA